MRHPAKRVTFRARAVLKCHTPHPRRGMFTEADLLAPPDPTRTALAVRAGDKRHCVKSLAPPTDCVALSSPHRGAVPSPLRSGPLSSLGERVAKRLRTALQRLTFLFGHLGLEDLRDTLPPEHARQ